MAFSANRQSTGLSSNLESDCNRLLDILTSDFLELQKAYDYLKENTFELASVPSKKYRSIRREIYGKLNNLPMYFKKLSDSINNIDNVLKEIDKKKNVNNSYQTKTRQSLNATKKKIIFIIDEAKEFEDLLEKKDKTINNFESTLQDSHQYYDDSQNYINEPILKNQEFQTKQVIHDRTVDNFRASLIEIKEIVSIEEIVKQREGELKDIHKVTGLIKDMTSEMKTEVNKQGDLLSKTIFFN